MNLVKDTPVKKLVLVAARRQAVKAEQSGADAVMVVGHEGEDTLAEMMSAQWYWYLK